MFYYDIYSQDRFVKTVYDKDYATYYILTNPLSRYNIYEYADNKSDAIFDSTITIVENKVVKIIDDNYVSIYSPYDSFLFNKSELSRLYLKFYDPSSVIVNNITNINNKINTSQNKYQTHQVISHIKQIQPIKTHQKNAESKQEIKQDIKQNTQIKEPVILSLEELNDIKNKLEEYTKVEQELSKVAQKIEDEYLTKDCNKRFEEKMAKREHERNKEKYNIFVADIKIYNRLISEKKFSESNLPPFFVAKYYILKYLFTNDYFLDENIDEPSKETYDLYKLLYDYINSDFTIKDNEDEELCELYEEFKDSLPDIDIKTDRQIMTNMNNKNDNDNANKELFNEETGYELEKEEEEQDSSSSSLNSSLNSDSDSDSDADVLEEVDNVLSDINKYKQNKRDNKIDDNFKNKYNLINYMFKEGHFDNTDLSDSVLESFDLYNILLEYTITRNQPKNIDKNYLDELNNYKKTI
jgi:hypothetical protein